MGRKPSIDAVPSLKRELLALCIFSCPFTSGSSTQILKKSVMIAIYLGQRKLDAIRLNFRNASDNHVMSFMFNSNVFNVNHVQLVSDVFPFECSQFAPPSCHPSQLWTLNRILVDSYVIFKKMFALCIFNCPFTSAVSTHIKHWKSLKQPPQSTRFRASHAHTDSRFKCRKKLSRCAAKCGSQLHVFGICKKAPNPNQNRCAVDWNNYVTLQLHAKMFENQTQIDARLIDANPTWL